MPVQKCDWKNETWSIIFTHATSCAQVLDDALVDFNLQVYWGAQCACKPDAEEWSRIQLQRRGHCSMPVCMTWDPGTTTVAASTLCHTHTWASCHCASTWRSCAVPAKIIGEEEEPTPWRIYKTLEKRKSQHLEGSTKQCCKAPL